MKRFRELAPPTVLHPLRVEQHEEVERARISQLARAERADTEDGHPACSTRLVAIRGLEDTARRCLLEQPVKSAGDGGIGNAGQGRRHLV